MLRKWENEIEVLIKIMKEVIPMTLKIQESLNQTEIKHKTDGSIVSICDFATQAVIMHYINKLLPDDDVLGEEEIIKLTDDFLNEVKQVLPQDIDPIESFSRSIQKINPENKRVWVIDPIDGTEGFVNHSCYAIATCLLVDLKPQVSVTAWPLHDPKYTGINMEGPLIFIAIEGGNSYVTDLNNHIKIMPRIKIPEKVHLTNNKIGYRQKYIKNYLGVKNSICLFSMIKGFVLSCGKANVYIRMHEEAENAWDIAPFEIFLRNCGGKITLGNGSPIEYLPNGKIKGSANAGIVCSIGGNEWHEKVLRAYRSCLRRFALYRIIGYLSVILIILVIMYCLIKQYIDI